MPEELSKLINEIPMAVAHYMNGRIRQRWSKDLWGDPRIPPIKPSSLARRRRKASRGKQVVLFDEGDMLRATQTVDLGPGQAAVTNTNKKAVWHFFGVPEQNLPARDVFQIVIEDAVAADEDKKIIDKMLDRWEQDWERRR